MAERGSLASSGSISARQIKTHKGKVYPPRSLGTGSSLCCTRAASHGINAAATAQSPVQAQKPLPAPSHPALSNPNTSPTHSTENCPLPSLQIKCKAVTSAPQPAGRGCSSPSCLALVNQWR